MIHVSQITILELQMWGASSVRSHWLDQMNIESERQVPETARALSDTNFLVSRRQTHNNIRGSQSGGFWIDSDVDSSLDSESSFEQESAL
jgi:hypothetical protein